MQTLCGQIVGNGEATAFLGSGWRSLGTECLWLQDARVIDLNSWQFRVSVIRLGFDCGMHNIAALITSESREPAACKPLPQNRWTLAEGPRQRTHIPRPKTGELGYEQNPSDCDPCPGRELCHRPYPHGPARGSRLPGTALYGCSHTRYWSQARPRLLRNRRQLCSVPWVLPLLLPLRCPSQLLLPRCRQGRLEFPRDHCPNSYRRTP